MESSVMSSTHEQILQVPNPGDDMDKTMKIVQALSSVVDEGKSIAAATGYVLATNKPVPPEDAAMSHMTPEQELAYRGWKSGADLPQIEWTVSRVDVPGGPQSDAHFSKRAAAMRVLFKDQDIDQQNAVWLTFNAPDLLPLVKAVEKILNAERDSTGGQVGIKSQELADYQTLRKVIGVASSNANKEMADLRAKMKAIMSSVERLQAQEKILKAKVVH
ncbi:hypothetical protein K470DRAFT_272491 [Piedraia hortae CBS 480.64]|uniref:Uncharacterized protein n=1 Tax=Piedraia hortae CBS 480.64 TaxID=1314780 RepID=A0A6A7BTS9_9PEZI|nr:hypothetical protein K470DRAFT_272491 [Piedraia hortae CBS 480.64]